MNAIIDMFWKNKMVLVLIGVVIGGFMFYKYIGGDSSASLITETNQTSSPEARAGERAILDTLFQLKAITLSGSIFNNPAFTILRDFRTEIVAEPIGRKNPFAPIAGLAAPSSATTTQTKQPAKSIPAGLKRP